MVLQLGAEVLTPICPTRTLNQSGCKGVRGGGIKCLPCPYWGMWLSCLYWPASRSHTPQVGASHPGQAAWSTTVSAQGRPQAITSITIIISNTITLYQQQPRAPQPHEMMHLAPTGRLLARKQTSPGQSKRLDLGGINNLRSKPKR